MTDAGPPPNENALVEALEARARQAGSEGAMTLLRGMLGTLSETMANIDERLGRIEARSDDQSGEMALAEAVQSALTNFNTRLGRLEEAFVQAVEESGSGTQQIVDQIREAVLASLPSPALDAPAAHPAPEWSEPVSPEEVARGVIAALTDRLDGLDRRLAGLERVEGAVQDLREPLAAIERVEVAVRGLREPLAVIERVEGAVRDLREPLAVLERMDDAMRELREPLAVLERVDSAVRELRDRPPPEPPAPPPPAEPPPPAIDPELVARLDGAIDAIERLDSAVAALGRDEASVRTVALIEERMAALVKVIGERTDDVRNAVQALADRPVPELPAPPPPPPPLEPPDLSALERIEDELRRLADRPVPELAPPPLPPLAPPPIEIPIYELSDIVHRESELLTQRVAALAVGVEATRAMLEQLVADMEASLGRKATEVGRRLAADLGLRSRRNVKRRDRELGPGA